MSGRRAAVVAVAAISLSALYGLANAPEPATAAEMCPPVTMDILFPPTTIPETTTTVATTTPTTTATTVVTTTTTAAPTTSTIPPPPPCEPFVYEMLWPLAAPGRIGSPFGADRDGGARKHQGNDIAAPRLTPVLAVADGVVATVAQEAGTEDCCWATIQHGDGWQSYYIHLNNDRYGTDDGLGVGFRTDLVAGAAVSAGEVIGWVGDSGNAEDTVDHLHFELRDPDGIPIDPRPSLETAIETAVLLEPQPNWPFADDDGHVGEPVAAGLLSEGLLLACDGSRINLCPDEVASPDLAHEVVDHLGGEEPPRIEGRYRPLAEGTAECGRLDTCLLFGLPETELARLAMWVRTKALVAALRPAPPDEEAPEIRLVSAGEAESLMRTIGAREDCNPPLDDHRLLTRAETLIRLVAWAQGTNPEPCSPAAQPTR